MVGIDFAVKKIGKIFVSGCQFALPRGQAAVECDRTHRYRKLFYCTLPNLVANFATTRTSRGGMPHAFELASKVATIGDQNSMVVVIGIWLPIVLPFGQAEMESNPPRTLPNLVANCATTRTSRSGMRPPHAFELASMVTTIGDQNQLCYHAGKPRWKATARGRGRLDGSDDSVSGCQLCSHSGKPKWKAIARLRACLDGYDDW